MPTLQRGVLEAGSACIVSSLSTRGLVAIGLGFGLLSGACMKAAEAPPTEVVGGQAAPPPSPSGVSSLPPQERERHVADAEAELSYAERALDESLRNPRPRLEPKKKPVSKAEEQSPADPASDTCSVACTALASMRRSAEFLCRLTGPDDGRCAQARARVERARARIERAECRCPAD